MPGFFMAKYDDNVSLIVDGEIFSGWLAIDIAASIQSLARKFSFRITGSLRDELKAKSIQPGKSVVVKIGDDVVVTGFVTEVDASFDGFGINVTVNGASKTIDLEDCTIPSGEPLQYKNRTVAEILKALCGYFGVEVVDDVGCVKRCDFNAGVTDTIKQSIVKLAKARGILASDDNLGRLVIANVAQSKAASDAIELGVNVLAASRKRNIRERFYSYTAVGQQTNALSENEIGAIVVKQAVDKTFERMERSKVFQLTGNADAEKIKSWICVVRDQAVADGDYTLEYTVRGWRQSNGDLWEKNTLVTVKDFALGVNRQMLIHSVKFSMSEKGMVTELSLKPADAFLVTDAPDKTTAKDTGGDLSGIIKNSGKIK